MQIGRAIPYLFTVVLLPVIGREAVTVMRMIRKKESAEDVDAEGGNKGGGKNKNGRGRRKGRRVAWRETEGRNGKEERKRKGEREREEGTEGGVGGEKRRRD